MQEWERGYQDALNLVRFAASNNFNVEEVVELAAKIRVLSAKWGEAKFAEFLTLLGPVTKERALEVAAIEQTRKNLWRSVDELELSVRPANGIANAGTQHVYEIVLRTEVDWLKTKNFGRKSLRDLKELLQKLFGLPRHVSPFGIELDESLQGAAVEASAVIDALAIKIVAMR